MKFAIWCAVSTAEQARGEKDSLNNQEKKSREVGLSKGWTESVQPFIVPGESRTKWVNLRDAEENIPALHSMLESAKRRDFDVLIIYDYNRFRDLLDQVAKTLSSYGVQIASVSQWVEPLPPDEFNMYASDSESIMRGMAQIISRAQIADFRRKYYYGMNRRVSDGLYSSSIPWGYKKNGRGVDLVPEQAAVLLEIKNMFLAGVHLKKILRYLNDSHPTAKGVKEWARTTIVYMLKNPFYAGKVFFGTTKRQHDPHHNITKTVPNPNPNMNEGKHEPLWSWDDYLRILAEFERRSKLPSANEYTYSYLLYCSVCGRKLNHWLKDNRWRCEYRSGTGNHNHHKKLTDKKAHEVIAPAIQAALIEAIQHPIRVAKLPEENEEVESLKEQRLVIQRRLEKGIYNEDEAARRIRVIDKQIADVKAKNVVAERQAAEIQQTQTAIEELREILGNKKFVQFVIQEDPGRMNRILLRLIERIEVSPDLEVKVTVRGFRLNS